MAKTFAPMAERLFITLPAPPSVWLSFSTATTGTGASGEILSTLPHRYSSSIKSPMTSTRRSLNLSMFIILLKEAPSFRWGINFHSSVCQKIRKHNLKLIIGAGNGNIRKIIGDGFRRFKEKALVCRQNHSGIIVGIAKCNDMIVQALEGFDRPGFLIIDSQIVSGDTVCCVHSQVMTKKRRKTQFFHERACKLFKGIGQNNNLGLFPDPIQHLLCTIKGVK